MTRAILLAFVLAIAPSGFSQTPDSESTIEELESCAEAGEPSCQNTLGAMYFYGEVVTKDYYEAAHWFRLAARQGLVYAQFKLGLLYSGGRRVSKDYQESAHWYGLAAEQGNAEAQSRLGLYLVHGRGVPQDHVQAYMWLSLAAAQGVWVAEHNRDSVATQMTPDQIAEAQRMAREWQSKE